MSAEQIARALGRATKGSDGWWSARCPAHDDTSPSLGLHDTEDGGVAWLCHAGCDSKAVGAALEARGLLPERRKAQGGGRRARGRARDRGPSPIATDQARDRADAEQPKPKRAKGRIVKTYDYVDERGEPLSQTVRFEPKDFSQRRPNGKGGWVWSLKGVRRVLYRLPELIAADPTEPVFITEGEKDVDQLWSLGLVATTNPEGAGKWLQVDPAVREILTGRPVVVLPDNDEAGRKHRAQVVRDRHGKAASLRVVELPGLPEKGDVSNWLDAGGTVEELRRLVAEAPEAEPEPEPEAEPKPSNDWRSRVRSEFLFNDEEKRKLAAVEANVATFLRHDPALKGRLRLNLMSDAPEHTGDLPWSRPGEPAASWREWADADDDRLCEYLQRRGLRVRPKMCATGVMIVAREHEVHPVREYLDGLRWNETPRLSSWLRDYCKVEVDGATPAETEQRRRYVDAAGRKWMISAVARAYEPGCKADNCLVLEGKQGKQKSTVLEIMAVWPEWYTDLASVLGSKDAMEDLAGSWIVELGELASLRGKDVNRMKAYLSRRSDKYRNPYGRRSTHHPRHNVFAGSVNDAQYLTDPTGGRRFWPVKVAGVDADALRDDRDQLWAEAVAAYKAKEKWWLDEKLEKIAGAEQEERRVEDPWEALIVDYLDRHGLARTTTNDLLRWAIRKDVKDCSTVDQMRVGDILKHLGWRKRDGVMHDGRKQKAWDRPDLPHPLPRGGGASEPGESRHSPTSPTSPTYSEKIETGPTEADRVDTDPCPTPYKVQETGRGGGGGGGTVPNPFRGKAELLPHPLPHPPVGSGGGGGTVPSSHCRYCGELVGARDPLVAVYDDGAVAHLSCHEAAATKPHPTPGRARAVAH